MRITFVILLVLIEIAAFLATLVSLVALIVGWGIVITLPLVFFLVMNVRAAAAIMGNEPFSPRLYRLYTASIILAALACSFGEWIGGHLSNIDTTGALDEQQFASGMLVVAAFTLTLLAISYSWQRSKRIS